MDYLYHVWGIHIIYEETVVYSGTWEPPRRCVWYPICQSREPFVYAAVMTQWLWLSAVCCQKRNAPKHSQVWINVRHGRSDVLFTRACGLFCENARRLPVLSIGVRHQVIWRNNFASFTVKRKRSCSLLWHLCLFTRSLMQNNMIASDLFFSIWHFVCTNSDYAW